MDDSFVLPKVRQKRRGLGHQASVLLFMNQSQNSALSYGPDGGTSFNNEFWDRFLNMMAGQAYGEVTVSEVSIPSAL
jgi:hypothetical protein